MERHPGNIHAVEVHDKHNENLNCQLDRARRMLGWLSLVGGASWFLRRRQRVANTSEPAFEAEAEAW